MRKELLPLYVVMFFILHKWDNLLVVKLTESIQIVNKNNNSLAYHILLSAYNNNNISPSVYYNNVRSNIICLKTINSNNRLEYFFQLQNIDLAAEQQDSWLSSSLIAREQKHYQLFSNLIVRVYNQIKMQPAINGGFNYKFRP